MLISTLEEDLNETWFLGYVEAQIRVDTSENK
jgi:hypothetical protein